MFGTFRGRSRQTGEEIALRFMHSLRMSGEGATLTEQKTVSFELFIDTAAVLRALGRSASGEWQRSTLAVRAELFDPVSTGLAPAESCRQPGRALRQLTCSPPDE